MTIPWTWVGAAIGAGVLGCVLVGCRSSKARGDRPEPLSLELTDVARGTISARMEPHAVIVRDAAAWQQLWASHSRLQLPPPPAPLVDFTREMVVAVFAGQCPTAGYGVEIEEVIAVPPAEDGAHPSLRVRALATQPDEGAILAQMVTAPFHAARVPLHEGELELVWE